MKGKFTFVLIGLIVLVAIAGFTFQNMPSAITRAAIVQQPAVLPQTNPSAPKITTLGDLESAYIQIYTQVSPSVVTIDVTTNQPANLPPDHPNTGGVPQGSALGSGFIWDTQGNIVTNNHVIDGADTIQVTFSDGTIVPAKLVGADPDSDLAVIKVNAPANLLRVIQMGDSTKVQVGQIAIAIGNPYGEQNTMTSGIISAIGRSMPISGGTAQGGSYSIPDVIQTDAPINPGNSGGVLLNIQGQVIGVTQSIESQSGASAGIGFAIPGQIVSQVVPALIKTGRYDHPYLGIMGGTLTPDVAQAMGLNATQRGAIVASVTPSGPAAKAGVQGSSKNVTINGLQATVGGDVITAIDGQVVKSFDDIVAYLARSTQVGQVVKLTVLRDGKEQTLSVTLAARPASQ